MLIKSHRSNQREVCRQTMLSYIISGLVGALASLIVTKYYEIATSPFLEVSGIDDSYPPTRRSLDGPIHKFIEVKVRQKKAYPPFHSRTPAWATVAKLSVHEPDGSRAIQEEITARWSGSPQPYQTQLIQKNGISTPVQVPESSLLSLGERFDVHAFREEKLGIALKYEGYDECWIFSNESYLHNWENPRWRLPIGDYYIRLELYYRGKPTTQWLHLANKGKDFDYWAISIINYPPFDWRFLPTFKATLKMRHLFIRGFE